jgi:hypothetical protein
MVCVPYKFCIDPPLGGVLYARGYYSEGGYYSDGGYYMLVYTVCEASQYFLPGAKTASAYNVGKEVEESNYVNLGPVNC